MNGAGWEISKFILQIALTLSGAFLAAWLATKRYRADKWWDKKEAAYSELINALHQMKWPASEHLDAEYEQRTIAKDESETLWRGFKDARRNVWKIAESSSFLLSAEVMVAVKKMGKGLEQARSAHTWFEHLDSVYAAIDNCIQEIKTIGHRDLGLKPPNNTLKTDKK